MRQRIDALTGLRGYLALWVFGFHAGSFFPASIAFDNQLFAHGYLAVDCFFILSGFVLFYVHGEEMHSLTFRRICRFLTMRIARIYPVHIFALTAYAAYVGLLLASHSPLPPQRYSAVGFIGSLTLTQTWIGYGLTWNIPAWSISTEWALYLAFPLLAYVAMKIPQIFFLAITIVFLVSITFLVGLANTNAVLRGLPSFLFGMALCKTNVWQTPLKLGAVAKFLSLRFSVFLGEISYAFYMLHFLVLTIVRKLLSAHMSSDASCMLSLIATIVLASLTLRYLERPARGALRTRLSAMVAA